jgi:hypothetical protein
MTKAAAKMSVEPTSTVAIKQHLRVDQRIVDDGVTNRSLPRGDAQGRLAPVFCPLIPMSSSLTPAAILSGPPGSPVDRLKPWYN